MIVNYIHNDFDAAFVKGRNHLFDLAHPALVIFVGSVPTVRRIKIDRHIAPEVIVNLVVMFEILNG